MDAAQLTDRTLDGKYRVVRVIAEGGMGVVVEAEHLALEHKVALKFPLVPAGIDVAEARGRLLREARAAAALKSEHVCRIFDVCELDSGEPYLVMELLVGSDLGARVGEKMDLAEAADLVRQACLGVAEAHARGIVHRDLKPENLFVTRDHLGRPLLKVLDFGISKMPANQRGRHTGVTTRDAMGSPLYMSPEQMLSTSDVDARADIWSLGVILYELVAGVSPFDAPNVPQVCVKVMRDEPQFLGDLRPDLPEAFLELVHRCLDKDPGARLASADELASALLVFAPGRARRISTPVLTERDPRATGVSWGGTRMAPPRKSRKLASALVVGALAGIAASIAIYAPQRIAEQPARAAAAAATFFEQRFEPPRRVEAAAPPAPIVAAPPPAEPSVEPVSEVPSAAPSTSALAIAPKPRPKPLRDYVAPTDYSAGPLVIEKKKRDPYEPVAPSKDRAADPPPHSTGGEPY